MDKTLDTFVDYAVKLQFSDLRPGAIHAVKRSLVDSIGCALGASRVEPVVAVQQMARQVTATRPATLIGTDIKTTPEIAAFANGMMIRYLDFSDDYFGPSGIGPHPSDNIGGVLAAAQSAGVDGKALILGIALAYEACGQLVDHTALRLTDGWDHPIFHSIATALGAGRMLGLSRLQMRHALALSVVPNICLYQSRLGELSNWKGCAGPNGSRNGLFAAQLARVGITGPSQPFEGKAGYMTQLRDPFTLGAFGGGKTPFKIERTFFKPLPLKYSVQLLVWTALELRRTVSAADIQSICIYCEDRSVVNREEHSEYWDPNTRETADHSNPFLVAAALVDGEINAKTFTPERYRAPEILALMQNIRIAEDKEYTVAFPAEYHCRMEVTLTSGACVSIHKTNPKGHPANPMSDAELEIKFQKQSEGLMPESQVRALLDQLWALEQISDIEHLLAMTRITLAR